MPSSSPAPGAVQQYQQAQRRWRGAFFLLSAYTFVIRELADDREKFDAAPDDAPLRTISHDPSAPRAHRVLAAFTCGFALWARGDRAGAVRQYRAATELATAATAYDRSAQILVIDPATGGPAWKRAGDQIDADAQTAGDNMVALAAAPASGAAIAAQQAMPPMQSGQTGAAQRSVQ